MKTKQIKDFLLELAAGQEVVLNGWIRTRRESKNAIFISIADGSTIFTIQAVAEPGQIDEEILKKLTAGASVQVKGTLEPSQGSGQASEIKLKQIQLFGPADPESYPLQPKRHSLEFLRNVAHLRPRTNTFGAVLRIRHAMALAIHQFFDRQGFFYLNTPIITASDAEGAGEMFHVTTLDLANIPKNNKEVDYSKDFFGRETGLTVSGQLEGELAAMGLSKIYTFGPTFRAENSNTTRHLAEFWMVEPEMTFYDLEDNMALAEQFLKEIISQTLEKCPDDLTFLANRLTEEEKNKPQNERAMPLLEKLRFVLENSFERITYSQAVDILISSKPNKEKKFAYPVEWGIDLQSEHERYLVEKHYKKPIIISDYPRHIKAFYMKQSADGKTVRAMDVLFPGIGEIIGGSQREDDLEKLLSRMREVGIEEQNLWWYLDTRKYGSVPHSGFGLGFERMIMFITGMSNIRDVIPFPRFPKSAEF